VNRRKSGVLGLKGLGIGNWGLFQQAGLLYDTNGIRPSIFRWVSP